MNNCEHIFPCPLYNIYLESTFYLFIFNDFIYLLLERGEGREKERERNINVWLPLVHPLTWSTTQACAQTGNQTGPFGSQAHAQPTELLPPRLHDIFKSYIYISELKWFREANATSF